MKRLVRTVVAIAFDDDHCIGGYYRRDTLVPGILCEAAYEDEREGTIRPLDYPHLVARVCIEAYEPAGPLSALAEQAE